MKKLKLSISLVVVVLALSFFVINAYTQNEFKETLVVSKAPARALQPNGAFCLFYIWGDNVHISSSPPTSASGHGWWTNGDCSAYTAVVTVQLQQKRYGIWWNVGTAGQKTVYPGGGSANRANGRAVCNSTESTEWRSVIDVDLVGVIDLPQKLYKGPYILNCRN